MWWSLVAVAVAADPTLVLPPGQDVAVWAGPAALAGFHIGAADGGREVVLVAGGAGWTLVARDEGGREKRVQIAAPVTPQAREDAVWLGSSLLASLPTAAPLPAATQSPTAVPLPTAAPSPAAAPSPTAARPKGAEGTSGGPASPTRTTARSVPVATPAAPVVTPAAPVVTPAAPVATPAAPVAPPAPPVAEIPPGRPAGAEPIPAASAATAPSPAVPTPDTVVPTAVAPTAAAPTAAVPTAVASTAAVPTAAVPTSALRTAVAPTAVAPTAAGPTLAPPAVSSVGAELAGAAAAPVDAEPPRVTTTPSTDPAAADTTGDAPLRAWLAAGPATELRSGLTAGVGGTLDLGVRVSPSLWVGATGRWAAPRTLPDVPGSTLAASTDVAGGLWWSPDRRVAPIVGGALGVSTRRYEQGGAEVDRFTVPVAAGELGAAAPLGPHLSALLAAHAGLDLAATEVVYGEGDPTRLPPWALGARFLVRAEIP